MAARGFSLPELFAMFPDDPAAMRWIEAPTGARRAIWHRS